MRNTIRKIIIPFLFTGILSLINFDLTAQTGTSKTDLDKKVEQFLEKHKYKWHDMNIPTADGKFLYNLIIKNNYKNAIEIGTSTGHSAIWIAWALSKTGGKLTTIEINESRHQKALANFKEAGLEAYIDAKLDDAHKLVPKLKGPIDFVFCDADKGWYKNYFKDIERELIVGGCFAAHNVSENKNAEPSVKDYLEYIRNLPNYKTSIENESSSGISISYKTGHK
jgi:caffeoyl-CoA O-methyltransferase